MGGNRLWNIKKEELIQETSGSSVRQLFSSGMGVIEGPSRKVIAGQNSVPNFLATGIHMKQVIYNEFKDKSFLERNLSLKQVDTASHPCFNINIH